MCKQYSVRRTFKFTIQELQEGKSFAHFTDSFENQSHTLLRLPQQQETLKHCNTST